MLKFDAVAKRFETPRGAVLAVDRFSLEVRDGEFLTIVGPSGCGKSTLLNLVIGLERLDGGTILREGRPSWETRLRVGYVTQEDNLYPWRTLLQNVEFPLELRGVPERERRATCRDWLARVGLEGFENRFPHELSGGMRQRGNIVRALSFEPDILLMDEPFGPLDAQTRTVLQDELLKIWEQARKTVIFITHDLQEAIALGDRVVVMTARPGRIKSVHEVEIPRPRAVRHIHEDARFRSLLSQLWEELSEEVQFADKQRKAAQ